MAGFWKVRTIKEIVGDCETYLSCKMVTDSRTEDGLVVGVEDGTYSQVVSADYRGQDTITQEEAGNTKYFFDLLMRISSRWTVLWSRTWWSRTNWGRTR